METIGQRIKVWRRRRHMSQQMLADLAGVSQPFVSYVEQGTRTVERRSTLTALASALQVSVAELVGAGEPGDPVKDRAAAAVPAIREALVMREAGEVGDPLPGGTHKRAKELGSVADYATLLPLLPPMLAGSDGVPLVHVCYETVFALKYLGYPDLARDAAGLGLDCARKLGEPAMIGMAEFFRAHALPTETSALAERTAARAADELQPHTGDPDVRQAYGMLHLTAALRAAAAEKAGDARQHLDEATAEAERLGEPEDGGFARMCFGPSNVGAWRMSIGNELGDPDETLRVAGRTDWHRLPTQRRQASYHTEHGRALATVGGRDEEAVLAFLQAEEIAPQQVRLDQNVRDAVAAVRKRTRDAAVSRPLRRLAAALEVA